MSLLCTIHLKKTDCSNKKSFNAVICEKNDVIGQNNVKLSDLKFIGKTISQLLEGLEPLFFRGLWSQMNGSEVTDFLFSWDVYIISKCV